MQVCPSAEGYQGYDGELGLCVCRQPPGGGGGACDGSRGTGPTTGVKLQCRAGGETELVYEDRVRRGPGGGACPSNFNRFAVTEPANAKR